ncbi:phosphate acyltransferase PlsX [Opitutales bacterium]|jgi:glycerol-3-phosphate acyltransferase PlsX|nr:phosphate acyltransferase PlsX [Opitutales bacterium]MDG1173688.1 phosphate acyltransferase PlsX [Opitutales bacterium]
MGSPSSRITLAVDAMGGDKGPSEILAGIAKSASFVPRDLEFQLFGREDELSTLLSNEPSLNDLNVTVHHAPEVVEMDEKPIAGIKNKKKSSMALALESLKEGNADALLSCGNTGCLMAGGTIRLRTLEGVERPALCTIWPGRERYFTLLDAGANPHPKPFHIVQNAILGSNYARVALGLVRPKVGLLSIGTEEGKGNELIHDAHEMLKEIDGSIVNYAGLIEGFQIFENVVDVVVCDGFVGNIVLKACESLSKLIGSFLDEELKRNALRKTGALLSMGAFRGLKQRINPEQFGGAPLLGLNRNVIKAHGSSNRNHVSGAIKIALDLVQHDMIGQMLEDVKGANEILRPFHSPPTQTSN